MSQDRPAKSLAWGLAAGLAGLIAGPAALIAARRLLRRPPPPVALPSSVPAPAAPPSDDEPPGPAAPSPARAIGFAVVALLALVLLITQKPPASTRLFVVLLALSLLVAAWDRARQHARTRARIARVAQGARAALRRGGVKPARLALFGIVIALCVAVLAAAPRQAASGLLALIVVGSVGVGVLARELERRTPRDLLREAARTLDAIRPRGGPAVVTAGARAAERRIPPLWAGLELTLVVGMAVTATLHLANPDPRLELSGGEQQWLTSSAHFAAQSLREYGTIPLWQPYLEMGEPLVDNPFAFIFNPVSALPSLILGSVQGIKVSVILSAVLAGLGGWFMARVMGLGAPGRLMLAFLVAGKGNMIAMFGTGYYQLAATQAYFPWILGGVIATLRIQHRRWPIVLTAVAFTLQFWAGNIWYVLPMILCTGALALAHAFGIWGRPLDWSGLRRLALAGLLALGLSAITLLPIWLQRQYIGGHPDEVLAGRSADAGLVIQQFFASDFDLFDTRRAPGAAQFYYSYVVPLWFLLLIFVLVPSNWSFRHQPGVPESGRFWLVALAGIAFFTVWGVGGSPIMVWLYEHVPLLRQWRFVGRALAVASFWIAVIVALRVDGLWAYVTDLTARQGARLRRTLVGAVQVVLAAGLFAASAYAAGEVNNQWRIFSGLTRSPEYDAVCLAWLRERYPDEELYVYRLNYTVITPFLDYHVRIHDIEADYFPVPVEWTLGHVNLTLTLPEFGLAWTSGERNWLSANDYRLMLDSPNPVDEHHCLYQRTVPTLDYAFTVTLGDLDAAVTELDPTLTQPVERMDRRPDTITLWLESPGEADPPRVLVVEERAYPGWQVEVDGQAARLESVGGLVGVVLPQDGAAHEVRFAYRPPLFYAGAALTLLTWALCILYLLRADVWLPGRWHPHRTQPKPGSPKP